MTDIKAYLDYFQILALQHVDIKSYYVMDINEPLAALRSEMQFPALIMNTVSGNFTASNLDNVLDEIKGGFLIIGRLTNIDDFSGEMLLLEQMKRIGTDIVSRMNHDLMKCEPRSQKAILGFRLGTVSYQMVDAIFDNCFGFLFSFRMVSKIDIDYNPTKWQ
jgi:hypothetical protein